jgi:hypothetical protein
MINKILLRNSCWLPPILLRQRVHGRNWVFEKKSFMISSMSPLCHYDHTTSSTSATNSHSSAESSGPSSSVTPPFQYFSMEEAGSSMPHHGLGQDFASFAVSGMQQQYDQSLNQNQNQNFAAGLMHMQTQSHDAFDLTIMHDAIYQEAQQQQQQQQQQQHPLSCNENKQPLPFVLGTSNGNVNGVNNVGGDVEHMNHLSTAVSGYAADQIGANGLSHTGNSPSNFSQTLQNASSMAPTSTTATPSSSMNMSLGMTNLDLNIDLDMDLSGNAGGHFNNSNSQVHPDGMYNLSLLILL